MFLKTILSALACPDAEVALTCVDDAAMRELNRRWRNKDKTTDVLSFSQVEDASAESGFFALPSGPVPRMLGDVVVSMPTAQAQAHKRGHSLDDEMARLLVHGVLHLLGHDHVHGGRQAKKMRDEERRLLLALGKSIHI